MKIKNRSYSAGRVFVTLVIVCLVNGTLAGAAETDPSGTIPILSAEAAVREALENNPDLASLEARSRQAASTARASEADRLPRLSANAASTHFTDPMRVRPPTANNQAATFSPDLWQANLSLNWTLYSGGRLSATAEADRLLAASAGEDVRFFRQRLATRVAQLYFEYAAFKAIIAASEKSLASLREQENRIQQLLEQGKAAEVDKMRLQVRSASVEQLLIQQRNERTTLHATLNFLIGRPLDNAWECEARYHESALTAAADMGQSMDGQPVAVRGDLTAARYRVEAAQAGIEQARAAFRPDLQLIAEWGPRGDWQDREQYEQGFIGFGLNWNLWDGGSRKARLQGARELERARLAEERSLSENRRLEIITARKNLEAARERLDVMQLSTRTAAESLRIEQNKYMEGKGTIIDILDAETAALETESLYQRAQADVRTSLAALDLALGNALSPRAQCTCLGLNFEPSP